MRWSRIGLYSLAGLLAVLLTAFAVLLTVDFGRFKERIEVATTDFLDREFRIDGAFHAYFGSNIEVYAEGVYLANPAWADEGVFVSARRIDVAVDLWSLVGGPIKFDRLEIDGVRVHIEKNDAGDASWSFAALTVDPDEAEEEPVKEETAGRLPVLLNHTAITDTRISYRTSTMGQPLVFEAESLIAGIDGDELKVVLVGALNETPLRFEKTTKPVKNLLEYRDVTVDLQGNIGEVEILGSVWADDLLSPRRPKLKLKVSGPNAQYLTDILLMQPVTTGPLDLSVSIDESDEQMLAILEGVFGEFKFNVNGRFQDIQELDHVHLEVSADGPDIGTIIRMSGWEYEEKDAFSIHGKIDRAGPEVTIKEVLVSIGESKLTIDGFFAEFPTANGANLSLVASGPDYARFNRMLGMPGRLTGSFTTSLDVSPQEDGRTLIDLDANTEHVRVQLHSLLSSSENYVGSTAQLTMSGANINIVAAAAGFEGLPAEKFEIAGLVEKDAEGFRLRNVRALVGDDLIEVSGHLGDRPLAGDTDLEIALSGTDLGASAIALGGSAQNLPKGAYHLSGKFQKQGDKLWLRDIEAAIGDNAEYELELSGFLTTDQEFEDSQVSVRVKGASLAALAELARVQGVPDFPFELKTDVRRGAANTYIENGLFKSGIVEVAFDGHVGDKPLEDDLVFSFDADVPRMKNVIAEFGIATDQMPAGDLLVSGTLRNSGGRMSLQKFVAKFEGATLEASGRIGTIPTLEGTSIRFSMDGSDLSRLLPPGVSGESLVHDFSAEGRVVLDAGGLRVDGLDVSVGHTTLGGEFALSLDPVLGSGDFDIKAGSPDLFQLFPHLREIAVPQVAKMKFRGSGSWSDNYWRFDDVELLLGKGSVSIDGGLDGPPNFSRTNLNVAVHASSMRSLSVLAGREMPDQAVDMVAQLVGTDDLMSMEHFSLTFGESDISGDFSMRSGEIPSVRVDVRSKLFDISDYAAEPEESSAPPPPIDKNRKVIPDTPLPLALLRSFDADIKVSIDEFRTRALVEKGLVVDAQVYEGALIIKKLSAITQRAGVLSVSGSLVPNQSDGAKLDLKANGDSLVMGFVAKTEEDLQQLPLFDLNAELTAEGATVRDLAGSLNGYIRLVGSEGRVPSGAFSLFTQDFVMEVFNAVNPFAKTDPYTNVECAAILVRFENGVVSGKPVLVQQTEKLRLFANTEIDLSTEKLDADFKMVPQKGLGISVSGLVNPYISITGTLGNPSLVLDPESVLIEGGVAVATAGLSILAKGIKGRFFSDKDPCGTAVTEFDNMLQISE